MKLVLAGIALAAGLWFVARTATGQSLLHDLQTSAGSLASPIVGR